MDLIFAASWLIKLSQHPPQLTQTLLLHLVAASTQLRVQVSFTQHFTASSLTDFLQHPPATTWTDGSMAATELLQLIITLCWTCLVVAPNKNALNDECLFCLEVLAELASAGSLSFCPGLLDVLQAASPPLVAGLKPSLPMLTANGVIMLWFSFEHTCFCSASDMDSPTGSHLTGLLTGLTCWTGRALA